MQARPGSFVLLGVETVHTQSQWPLPDPGTAGDIQEREKGETKEQRRQVGGLERGWQLRVARNVEMAFSHSSAKVASLSFGLQSAPGHYSRALLSKLSQDWKGVCDQQAYLKNQVPERCRAGMGSLILSRVPVSESLSFVICLSCHQILFIFFHFVCLQGHKGVTGPLGPPGPKGEKVGTESLSSGYLESRSALGLWGWGSMEQDMASLHSQL